MKIVKVTYGIGYGSHKEELEFPDDYTDEEIEQDVTDYVMDRLDFSYEVEHPDDR